MQQVGAVVVGVGLVLAACGDDGAVELPPRYERSCEEAEECPGRKCVRVGPNVQGVAGICSRNCNADVDCGGDAACFLLGEAGNSCLARCSDDDPCAGGFACVVVGAAGEQACFVEAP